MATALITAFLTAKMKNAKTSVALYSVSSDVDGAKIVQQMGTRINHAILRMLATSSESLTTDPQLVASILQGMMAGVSRRILESSAPEKQFESLRQELIVAACAYLDACSNSELQCGVQGLAKSDACTPTVLAIAIRVRWTGRRFGIFALFVGDFD